MKPQGGGGRILPRFMRKQSVLIDDLSDSGADEDDDEDPETVDGKTFPLQDSRDSLVGKHMVIADLLFKGLLGWRNDDSHPVGMIDPSGTFLAAKAEFSPAFLKPCDSMGKLKETILTAALQLLNLNHRDFYVASLIKYCVQLGTANPKLNFPRDMVATRNSAEMTPVGIVLTRIAETDQQTPCKRVNTIYLSNGYIPATKKYDDEIELFERLCFIDKKSLQTRSMVTAEQKKRGILDNMQNPGPSYTSLTPLSLACRLNTNLSKELVTKVLNMGYDLEVDVTGNYGAIWLDLPGPNHMRDSFVLSELLFASRAIGMRIKVYTHPHPPDHRVAIMMLLLEHPYGPVPSFIVFKHILDLHLHKAVDLKTMHGLLNALLAAGAQRGFATAIRKEPEDMQLKIVDKEQTLAKYAYVLMYDLLHWIVMDRNYSAFNYTKDPRGVEELLRSLFEKRAIRTETGSYVGEDLLEDGTKTNLLPCPKSTVDRLTTELVLTHFPNIVEILNLYATADLPEMMKFLKKIYSHEREDLVVPHGKALQANAVQTVRVLMDLYERNTARLLQRSLVDWGLDVEGSMTIIRECQRTSEDKSELGARNKAFTGPAGYINPNADGSGGD